MSLKLTASDRSALHSSTKKSSSDRSALIRLAASFPAGSDQRKAVLAKLDRVASAFSDAGKARILFLSSGINVEFVLRHKGSIEANDVVKLAATAQRNLSIFIGRLEVSFSDKHNISIEGPHGRDVFVRLEASDNDITFNMRIHFRSASRVTVEMLEEVLKSSSFRGFGYDVEIG